MKKTIYITIAMLGLVAGCTIEDSRTSGDRTSWTMSQNVHSEYLYPIYDMFQVICYFSEYQALLNGEGDADSAFDMGTFFGQGSRNYELDSTHFHSSYWGGIRRGDAEGEYIAYPYNAVNGLPEFRVTYTDSLTFEVGREWAADEKREVAKFDFHADVTYNKNNKQPLEISNFLLNYSDTGSSGDFNMTVEETETLKCGLYSTSSTKTSPQSGTLYFTISGKYDDWFTVTYGSFTGYGGYGYKIEGKY